jgi:hypothetical protein
MKEGDALKQINAQIVRLETQTLKNLLERELLSISDGNELVRRALHLGLDEPEQMLLVHGRRVVDVGVDLSDVCRYRRETQRQQKAGVLDDCSVGGRTVEVSVRDLLDLAQLAELVCKERKSESTPVVRPCRRRGRQNVLRSWYISNLLWRNLSRR